MLMSDPTFLESDDSVHGSSAAVQTTPPGLAANDIAGGRHTAHDDDASSVNDDPLPPTVIHKNHREGSASRVDIGHFDPIGVDELRRTMSHNHSHAQFEGAGELTRQTSAKSDLTLTDRDGPIDLEKRLRTVMRK